MSFLAELRSRSVYRVAALYLIVGWVVLQVVDVLTEFMPLPEWTGMLVFVLLAAGFPVSLVLSWQLGEDGRTAEAVALAREAMDLDPFTPSTGTTLAQALYLGGEFETSVQAWRDLVELDPADPSLRHYLGWALAETGTPDEAIDAHRTAVELSGRASLQLSGLGHALAVAGEREQSLALLGELDRVGGPGVRGDVGRAGGLRLPGPIRQREWATGGLPHAWRVGR